MNTTGVQITAGLGGFLVLFGLCLAVWFLGRDLTRRLRRMRRAEDARLEQERLQRERAAAPQDPEGRDEDEDPIG
ncbi:hypothetical protein [Serinicoccus sediminis]|uniref:hypothetical protein n=1 Tax=Serinicoccus sediminis TaxID=2306021 RepID=UPI0010229BBE|nr:hypothetical protein [Serinicoccus sediminis]